MPDYLVNDECHYSQGNEDNQHKNDDEFDGPLLVFLCFLQLLYSLGDLVGCLLYVVVNAIQYRTLELYKSRLAISVELRFCRPHKNAEHLNDYCMIVHITRYYM